MPDEKVPDDQGGENVENENAESTESTATVPVEEWIPHPSNDYVDWMDRPSPYYEGKPPVHQADVGKYGRPAEEADEEESQ